MGIHTAESLRSSLDDVKDKPSEKDAQYILYYTGLFFAYRLRFIVKGGGLIFLNTNEDSTTVNKAYTAIKNNFKFAGNDTPIQISYLQDLFMSKNVPEKPFVFYKFVEEFETDDKLNDIRNKLQKWLPKESNIESKSGGTKEKNIETLKNSLKNFIDSFNTSINNLYTKWGDEGKKKNKEKNGDEGEKEQK